MKLIEISNILKDIKMVLFDMDGTILNSEPLHQKSIKKVIDTLSITNLDKDFYYKIIGLSDFQVYKLIENNLKNPIDYLSFLKIKNSFFDFELTNLSHEKIQTLLTPGILTFLKMLKQKKNANWNSKL